MKKVLPFYKWKTPVSLLVQYHDFNYNHVYCFGSYNHMHVTMITGMIKTVLFGALPVWVGFYIASVNV